MKKTLLSILLITAMLLTVSCGSKETPQTSEPQGRTPEKTDISSTVTDTVYIAAETGADLPAQTIESPDAETTAAGDNSSEHSLLFPDHYPWAIMINNAAPARPQSGLDKAKIIYQMMTEGRTTRFLLVTDAKKGTVGPVRSARPAFLPLVDQHKAFYAHAGNYRVIKNSPVFAKRIKDFDCLTSRGSRLYYRKSHRKAPHNLYAELDKMYNTASKYHALEPKKPLKGLRIRSEMHIPAGGEKATRINYRFKTNFKESFRYNAKLQKYVKYNGKTALKDELSKKVIAPANVFLLQVPHGLMPNKVHLKITWIGSGKGVYFTGGKKYDITWEKKSHNDPLLFYLNGEEIVLNPGLTWVVVQDKTALKYLSYE